MSSRPSAASTITGALPRYVVICVNPCHTTAASRSPHARASTMGEQPRSVRPGRPIEQPFRSVAACRPVDCDPLLDKGLIGFDVETGSRIVRPELLRLVKRGTNTTADTNKQFALAA